VANGSKACEREENRTKKIEQREKTERGLGSWLLNLGSDERWKSGDNHVKRKYDINWR